MEYLKKAAGGAGLIEICENGGFYDCIKALQAVGGDDGGGGRDCAVKKFYFCR